MDTADTVQPKKKSGTIMTVVAIAVVTLVGAGGGWVVGGMLAPAPPSALDAAASAKPADQAAPAEGHGGGAKKEAGLPKAATEANGVLQLEPITANLAYPTENWIRLEVALQFKGAPDPLMAEQIHQDIAAYLKTISMQQIQGPRGFQYLKDDIQERVDLRSEGRVTNVIFRTFVVQ